MTLEITIGCLCHGPSRRFQGACRFSTHEEKLAQRLDSLVRVSRQVERDEEKRARELVRPASGAHLRQASVNEPSGARLFSGFWWRADTVRTILARSLRSRSAFRAASRGLQPPKSDCSVLVLGGSSGTREPTAAATAAPAATTSQQPAAATLQQRSSKQRRQHKTEKTTTTQNKEETTTTETTEDHGEKRREEKRREEKRREEKRRPRRGEETGERREINDKNYVP